ncbi:MULTISPECIES: PAS domain S-box protein [Myxococcaceae]|uniref:PAS domain S-box protein n=1 Tax=Myxococcaceae TaxID=31 RepID=UPI00188ECF60|nr:MULTISPECIES: PAS domain S-box protein [Myxococcaceae]MBF5043404.1 PAS domain S-box protein [Simulacricoccus sp. 17bor-14]
MTAAALHDEKRRLETLHGYALLDTPPDAALDDLTRVAAALCAAPIAFICLLDGTRSWFKARHGTCVTQVPRELAFCHYLPRDGTPLLVEDATQDLRFARSPLVTGEPHVRFYAGVPLRSPDGHTLGGLCVLDVRPRTLEAATLEALQALARQVMALLEQRRAAPPLLHGARAARGPAEAVAHLTLLDAALRALAQPTLSAGGLMLEVAEGARELTWAATALVTLREGEGCLTRCAGDVPEDLRPLVADGKQLEAPLLLGDCRADARTDGGLIDRARAAARGVASLAAAPLVLDGTRGGVLEVTSPLPHAFGERDLRTLQLLAHGAGMALARLRAVGGLALALEEQRRSEALFRSTFEHSPLGLVLVHPDGHLLRVNRAVCELFGYEEHEVLGQSAGRFVWPELEGWELPGVRELHDGTRTSFQVDRRYLHKSGRPLLARLTMSLVRDAEGAPLHYLGQLEDTSAATAAMETLMQQAELLEAAHDAIMGTDLDGRVTYWNRAAEELYGFRAQEALGQLSQELLHSQLPASPEQLREEFHRTGRWEGELGQTARDGRRLVVSSRWSLRRDAAGRPLGVLAVNRDVTARREAQDALARSEESLAATLRSLTEGVIVTDPDERVTRMNPAAEALTGLRFALAQGQRLSEVFPLVDELSGEALESPVQRAMRARAPVELADRASLRDRAGQRVPVAASGAPLRDARGQVAGGVLVFRDVTQERRAHDELRRKEQEFRQLIDLLPDAVIILRAERVLYANAALARLLGRGSPQALVGEDVGALVHPADRERMRKQAAQLPQRASGERAMSELRFARADGEELVVEVAPLQLRGFEGGPAVMLVGRDLTERRKLQQRLLLADRMASVGTLAAGVAHEINNPLAFVIGNLAFLEEELRELSCALADPAAQARLAEGRQALSEASQGAERVRLIVKDLHTFSRADEAQKGRLDVRRALESSIAMTGNVVRHRARLVRELAEVPAVWANEARLGQVFVNLLVNAAHAIPEGLPPASGVAAHEIHVRTRSAGPWVVVEVQDTGVGIAPQHRSRIFDPFFTTKPVGQGTGLGLAICHGIVTALGGKIELESEVGLGTTFRVLLPACAEGGASAPQALPAPPPARPALRGRVLVLDDEVHVGALVRRLFSGELEVVTETSPRQALARIASGEHYDAMLCDVMMPEMAGPDVHAEVSRLAPALASRMLFVTGGAFSPRAQAFLAGLPPGGFLTKPFELPKLRERLQTLVARREGC